MLPDHIPPPEEIWLRVRQLDDIGETDAAAELLSMAFDDLVLLGHHEAARDLAAKADIEHLSAGMVLTILAGMRNCPLKGDVIPRCRARLEELKHPGGPD